MAEGRETRAAIDSETVRGLLLINGGGAVALLAFLSTIIDKPGLDSLSRAIMLSTFLFQFGLAAAVIHNRFRRLCSFQYSKKPESRRMCSFFGHKLKEPCICHWSTGFMWASIVAFLAAGMVVLVAGLCVVNDRTSKNLPSPDKNAASHSTIRTLPSNNAFKPNLLRYTNNMAEGACHVVGSATQVGLT